MIVTHSCYITILSTTFTPAYLKYIANTSDKLDGDPPFLDIYCTKTHNLQTSIGRQKAAKDILRVCERLRADGRGGQLGDE